MAMGANNPAVIAGATAILALGLFLLLIPLAHAAEPEPGKPASAEARRAPGQPICATLPRESWMSWREVEDRLAGSGFRLVKLRFGEERCFTAIAKDAAGLLHTLVIHPATAEIVGRRQK